LAGVCRCWCGKGGHREDRLNSSMCSARMSSPSTAATCAMRSLRRWPLEQRRPSALGSPCMVCRPNPFSGKDIGLKVCWACVRFESGCRRREISDQVRATWRGWTRAPDRHWSAAPCNIFGRRHCARSRFAGGMERNGVRAAVGGLLLLHSSVRGLAVCVARLGLAQSGADSIGAHRRRHRACRWGLRRSCLRYHYPSSSIPVPRTLVRRTCSALRRHRRNARPATAALVTASLR